MVAFIKDPSAVLDYGLDWSHWLSAGETIVSAEWTIADGITMQSHSESATATLVWLSGGIAGQDYHIKCRITTSLGRVDERTITIAVRER